MEKSNDILLDIASIQWGRAPTPLLPRTFRQAFASIVLPEWVCSDLGLPPDSTVSDLGSEVWEKVPSLNDRIRKYLLLLVRMNISTRTELKCFDTRWPVGLKTDWINWSVRTRNRLLKYELLQDPQSLMDVTYGELLAMEGAGAMVVIDCVATLEGAIASFVSMVRSYIPGETNSEESGISNLLERVLDEPWSQFVSERDPRFRGTLPMGDGESLHDRIERLLSEPGALEQYPSVPSLLGGLDRIRAKVRKIDAMSLEESLADFLRSCTKETGTRFDALLARLGWAGEPAITLEQAGARLGVTRERLRQIQKKVLDQIDGDDEFYLPKLDEALILLESAAPLTVREGGRLLRKKGVSNGPFAFDVETLLEIAATFNRAPALSVNGTGQSAVVVRDQRDEWVSGLFSRARRLVGKSGASNVFQLQSILESDGHQVSEESIAAVLQSYGTVDFLDEHWFWVSNIPNERNRLRNLCLKMLAVVSPQSVISLRDGVRRNYKMRLTKSGPWSTLIVPPVEVMKTFFERHPDFEVQDDMVSLKKAVDYRAVLGDTDRVLVDVLRSAPAGVLDRQSFAEKCMQLGMNENTFSVFTSYSIVVEHLSLDLWKLRGTKVDPAEVQAYRFANQVGKRERRQTRFGWSDTGYLWIAAQIPKYGKSTMIVYAAIPIRRYVENQHFTAVAKDSGDCMGTISVSDNGTSWGYGRFMTRYGMDEDDVLLVEFDLGRNVAYLSIGSDDLLYEEIS
jgi:hypothetical protein